MEEVGEAVEMEAPIQRSEAFRQDKPEEGWVGYRRKDASGPYHASKHVQRQVRLPSRIFPAALDTADRSQAHKVSVSPALKGFRIELGGIHHRQQVLLDVRREVV